MLKMLLVDAVIALIFVLSLYVVYATMSRVKNNDSGETAPEDPPVTDGENVIRLG